MEGKECTRPCLENTSQLHGQHTKIAMETILTKKIRETLYISDEEQDGKLDMGIKFGRAFMTKTSAVRSIPIGDFTKTLPQQEKPFRVSFYPLPGSHEDIAPVLKASGFVKKDEPIESVSVKIIHSMKPYVAYNITMDRDFKFEFISPRDRRFFTVDIIAADPDQADVRAQIISIAKRYEFSQAEGPEMKYMKDDLVSWDAENNLIIKPGMEDKVSYASTRKETTYYLENPRFHHTVFEKNVEVRILEATHYDKPNDGRFTREETRCEVFLHVTSKEAIAEVAESDDFVQSMLSFSYKLNIQ